MIKLQKIEGEKVYLDTEYQDLKHLAMLLELSKISEDRYGVDDDDIDRIKQRLFEAGSGPRDDFHRMTVLINMMTFEDYQSYLYSVPDEYKPEFKDIDETRFEKIQSELQTVHSFVFGETKQNHHPSNMGPA